MFSSLLSSTAVFASLIGDCRYVLIVIVFNSSLSFSSSFLGHSFSSSLCQPD